MTPTISNNCCICHDSIAQSLPIEEKDGESIIDHTKAQHELSCGHGFHSGCIVSWLNSNMQCPLRCEIDTSIKRVHLEGGEKKRTLILEGFSCYNTVGDLLERINAEFPKVNNLSVKELESFGPFHMTRRRILEKNHTLIKEGIPPNSEPVFHLENFVIEDISPREREVSLEKKSSISSLYGVAAAVVGVAAVAWALLSQTQQ